jgi:hypothetical protein
MMMSVQRPCSDELMQTQPTTIMVSNPFCALPAADAQHEAWKQCFFAACGRSWLVLYICACIASRCASTRWMASQKHAQASQRAIQKHVSNSGGKGSTAEGTGQSMILRAGLRLVIRMHAICATEDGARAVKRCITCADRSCAACLTTRQVWPPNRLTVAVVI